jgi:excisionase family DNA binding protein
MEPLAVDIREAGRLTSLSPRTIRRQIKAGRIRSVRIGTRLLVPFDALRDWINQKSIRRD